MTCWNWKTGGTELSCVISVASFTLNRPSPFGNGSAVRECPSLSPSGAKIPPMSDLATQRDQWDGHPVELGDAWTLRKGQRLARCALVSNPFGWELRPMAGELVRSQVCRTQDEILDTQENRKAAMVARGWR